MFGIVGASGNTGKVVAERLLAQGAKVRVVVRDAAKGEAWAAKGADVAVADLLDADALTRAFTGVRGAYVLLPPNPVSTGLVAEQARKAEAIATAVKAAGVRHLVLLSSVAAQYPAGTGPIVTLHAAEARFAAAVPRRTFVRAAYFLENWGSSLGGVADGVFPTFLRPDVAIDMVATADIGREAADALLAGGVDGTEVVNLASGPGPVSPREIGALVSRLVGRELNLVNPPLQAIVPTFTSFGMSKDVASLYEEMITTFNGATSDPWERQHRFVRGPTTPEAVLRGLLGR
jgi:NAD(P)H dehydrogenase (quinone)